MSQLNKIYERVRKFISVNFKFLLFIIGLNLLFFIEVPYVIHRPGGSVNLSERIELENGYGGDGRIGMAYVSMLRGNIPFVLIARFIPNWAITSRNRIILENETINEALRRDRVYLEQAMNNAKIVAYRAAGKDIEITSSIHTVIHVAPQAETDLQIGDQITHVNEEKIESLNHYREIINRHEVGDILELTIMRNDREREARIKVFATEEGFRTGISVITTYELALNPPITIRSRARETGPSGGIMLALGIYDALSREDITRGRNIVGTGTINRDGQVGQIGGVRYKLLGAARERADIFIVPEVNYEEALRVKSEENLNIKIIMVRTFEEALEKLRAT